MKSRWVWCPECFRLFRATYANRRLCGSTCRHKAAARQAENAHRELVPDGLNNLLRMWK